MPPPLVGTDDGAAPQVLPLQDPRRLPLRLPNKIHSAYCCLTFYLQPDKLASANGGTSSTATTAAFRDPHHAYKVISDLKEYAYYDSHRKQILFSDPSSVKSNKYFLRRNLAMMTKSL